MIFFQCNNKSFDKWRNLVVVVFVVVSNSHLFLIAFSSKKESNINSFCLSLCCFYFFRWIEGNKRERKNERENCRIKWLILKNRSKSRRLSFSQTFNSTHKKIHLVRRAQQLTWKWRPLKISSKKRHRRKKRRKNK